ncbi:hypothetical protein LTR56_007967 [Elasticomyces elasticus]|nr:hypothetical protein LTR56_007967 [Elasticomyces elasticus]KAK3649086.1 hypothetical protein LTR22_013056 [Elasticomyces elasticus]KAK5748214.1 hypothetical protein LTS12_021738 [Elasticomyces elasticus]
MGLPAELRELVWLEALADDEPHIAYLERRVVARPNRAPNRPGMRSISGMLNDNSVPSSPPLLHVSKPIRREAFPIYWKSNTFAFSLCHDIPNQVGLWQSHVARTGCAHTEWPRSLPLFRTSILNDFWNVRLEFSMFRPEESESQYPPTTRHHSAQDHNHVATIEIRLADAHRRGKLDLIFGGVLAEACTCWPRAYAEGWSLAGEFHHKTIARFAKKVERQLHDVWGYSGNAKTMSQTERCEDCGRLKPKRSDTR